MGQVHFRPVLQLRPCVMSAFRRSSDLLFGVRFSQPVCAKERGETNRFLSTLIMLLASRVEKLGFIKRLFRELTIRDEIRVK